MQAFKLYFRVIARGSAATIGVYFVLFSLLVFMFSSMGDKNAANLDSYQSRKVNTILVNRDDSELSNGLAAFLEENANLVAFTDQPQEISDALFYRAAEYALTIPAGYGDAFWSGTPAPLQTTVIPDSASGRMMDGLVRQYLQTVELYHTAAPDKPISVVLEEAHSDLAVRAQVEMSVSAPAGDTPLHNFFNYLAYPLLAVLCFSITSAMLVVGRRDVKQRSLCAPVRPTSYAWQMFLGNAVLSLVIWAMYIVYAMVLHGGALFTQAGLLLVANSLLFSVVCLALGFLASSIVTVKTAAALCNTLALGFCFLGGAFVPQDLLSQTVRNLAVVDPVFWFIKSNDIICSLQTFDAQTLRPVWINMLVLALFAAAFLAVALLTSKHRKKQAA